MSSTVEMKWCVAPASRIASRTRRELAGARRGACGAGARRPARSAARGARARSRPAGRDRCAAAMPALSSAASSAAPPARPSTSPSTATVSPRGSVLGKPVDVRSGRAGRDLHQVDAAAGEFALGLHPVAAVGEQRRLFERDDQRAHRAGEARRPLPALPALGQVLGQVRIARRDDDGCESVARHRLTQAGNAGAHRGAARFEGVHDRGGAEVAEV